MQLLIYWFTICLLLTNTLSWAKWSLGWWWGAAHSTLRGEFCHFYCVLIAGYYFFSLIVVRIAFMTFFSLFALQLCINSYTFFSFFTYVLCIHHLFPGEYFLLLFTHSSTHQHTHSLTISFHPFISQAPTCLRCWAASRTARMWTSTTAEAGRRSSSPRPWATRRQCSSCCDTVRKPTDRYNVCVVCVGWFVKQFIVVRDFYCLFWTTTLPISQIHLPYTNHPLTTLTIPPTNPTYIPTNILSQENDGWTALHFAASTGNIQLITLLLQAGAAPGIRAGQNGEGLTAKELAVEEGFAEAAELIPDIVEQEL